MAVRINASGEYLRRTTSLPSSTAFTICGWMKVTDRTNAYQYFGLESATNYLLIGYQNTNPGVFQVVSDGSPGSGNFSSSPTNGTWIFFALTCSGTGSSDLKGYYAGLAATSFLTATCRGVSFTATQMTLGNDTYDEYLNAAYANIKIYDAALTEAELWNERQSIVPVRFANLHLWSPLWTISDINDYSGNGRNWTSGGTISTEDHPPVSYGQPIRFHPIVPSGTSYSINLDAGSYTITGQDPSLLVSRLIDFDAGSYTVSGLDPDLSYGRFIDLDAGSYTVTGQDPSLIISRLIDLDAGAYTISGLDPDLSYGRFINFDAGSYIFTGQDPSLIISRLIDLDAGAYTISGLDPDLSYGRFIDLDAGSYSISGLDPSLLISRLIDLDASSYTINGLEVTLTYNPAGGYTIELDAGSYTITGQPASLIVSRLIDLDAGSYTVSGLDPSLIISRLIDLDAGAYTISGLDPDLSYGRFINLDAGSYTITGQDPSLLISRLIELSTGSYTISGQEADLVFSGQRTSRFFKKFVRPHDLRGDKFRNMR